MKHFAEISSTAFDETNGRRGVGFKAIYMSTRRLLVFVLMLVLFMLATRPVIDPDFWWHLRTGQYIFETGTIPHTDPFSATRFGLEWVTHEWLSEVFIYAIHQTLGFGGLVVIFSLIITAALWIAYQRCAERAGHPYVIGFALILCALTASPTWGVRPQVFSFLFASIFLAVLDSFVRQGNSRLIWSLAPLMVLWVNMHAGFALGLVLIALAIIGLMLDEGLCQEGRWRVWPRVRLLSLIWLVCAAMVFLNPHGARLYRYPFETLTSRAMMKYIEEWFSPDFHQLMFQPFAVLIFATFVALALSKERARPSELLLLSATGYAALRSGRNVPFFALAAMPLLAEHAWSWITSHRWGRWLTFPEEREVGSKAVLKVALNLSLLIIIPAALCILRINRVVAGQATSEAQRFPVAAVDFIRTQRPPQPIYHEYGWGGYLIWKLYPEYRVYIDGRADVYGDAFMEAFLKTHDGEMNWREPLDGYGVRTVLIDPNAPLASLLRNESGWAKVFEDQQAVIFIRQ
ncbi:MAG TPA: hypothetical protein VD966_02750 [Pyrinomonadaceae bacterium]|nr:hypothetical protein [Pyrinomonadaceae bacterium]